ncbi:hypothetical protein CENSYa_0512 [Cenarchaeum symbiosum A]|uniref:Uncharacterized protein n=1 Tax=Cenarchaeum symbiosum (strain A) TaxID=414004 RepID=A0RUX8_CENSY|nr:hypothetical protein CENSYa_0512 [Cenarchaeum symbiosum A]
MQRPTKQAGFIPFRKGPFVPAQKSKNQGADWTVQLVIQILQYEFLGPVKLSEWGPPMEKLVYMVMARDKDVFNMIYVGECEKTDKGDYFTSNEAFKCWMKKARTEDALYLCILPMFDREAQDRKRVVDKIVYKYNPPCN